MRVSFRLETRAPADVVRACFRDELRVTAWYGEPVSEDAAAAPCCGAAPREVVTDAHDVLVLEARSPGARATVTVRFEDARHATRARYDHEVLLAGWRRVAAPMAFARMIADAARTRAALVRCLRAAEISRA